MSAGARRAPERLRTDRLRLRRPVREDIEPIFSRYAADAEVTRYLAWPRHQSLADTAEFVNFSDREWTRYGCGPYLVESTASGQLLGGTGLGLVASELAETGYVFARDAWGYGYATECLRAMIDVSRNTGISTLRAQCHPAHFVSAHVLEKCGFVLAERRTRAQRFPNLDPAPQDVLVYLLVVSM